MPHDSRHDVEPIDLPSNMPQFDKPAVPRSKESKAGSPFMRRISLTNFRPDAALQAQIDEALGPVPDETSGA